MSVWLDLFVQADFFWSAYYCCSILYNDGLHNPYRVRLCDFPKRICVRSEAEAWNYSVIVLDFFPSISLSLCWRTCFCTSACHLLTKWGYSVSLSTVNFNNLLEGPLTVSFYHIINDDSIFLCHSISSTDPRPYYRPVMKCNGVVIGPHYTRSGNIRLIFLSQWVLLVTLNEKPNTVPFLCRLSSK